jgi:DNA-binding transcriptional LysR family regulator
VRARRNHVDLNPLPELRLADLVTLLAVHRTSSISGAARELRVTPSQVSKAMVRLERHFGTRLLSRGARGVAPTAAGRQMLPRIANAVEELRASSGVREDQEPLLELNVAGPSYLVGQVLPAIAEKLAGSRIRGLELVPAYLRAYVAENVFDVALAPGGIQNRPAAWTSDRVTTIRMALLARPSYAQKLAPLPLTPERVRPLPFVGPTRAGGDRFVAVHDDCPLPREERWIAHECQTVGGALEFVSRVDHVVYCPRIAARRFLAAGLLVELPVVGWDFREPLFVVCNGDRVLARARAAVIQAAQDIMESADV